MSAAAGSLRSVRRVALAALLACAVVRCGMEQSLRDIFTLQQGLTQKYHEAPSISVTGSVLTVTFQNSERASLPEDDRAAMAHEVAEFVRDHYSGYGQLTRVQVGFVTSHQYGPVSTSRSEVPYSYAVQDLGSAPPAPSAPGKASAPN